MASTGLRIAAVLLWIAAPQPAAQSAAPVAWLKGSLHTHTDRSDGDSSPETVIRWYREHGYRFVALTDHDQITDVAPLAATAGPKLVLVPAEEVTGLALPGDGRRVPVHVNAFGPRGVVEPFKGGAPGAALAENVARARAAEALVLVNHPNFGWALGAEDLKAAAAGFRLLEIFSGHPLVHHQGGGGALSAEGLWDALLTAGHRVYGTAVDDSHHFGGECTPARACPGRGWVVVRAESTVPSILAALDRGDFYGSNGVELRDVRRSEAGLEIEIAPQKSFRYRTEFIGPEGLVVGIVDGESATWWLDGTLGYVRARITDSMGRRAWTQPAFAPAAR